MGQNLHKCVFRKRCRRLQGAANTSFVCHIILGFLWVAAVRWIAPTGLLGARTSWCECARHLPSASYSPRFLPSSAFRPAYPLPVHDPSPSFPSTKSPFYLFVSLAHCLHTRPLRILRLSPLALQGPRWVFCLPQRMDSNSYHTSVEEVYRKEFWKCPNSTGKLRCVRDGSIGGE